MLDFYFFSHFFVGVLNLFPVVADNSQEPSGVAFTVCLTCVTVAVGLVIESYHLHAILYSSECKCRLAGTLLDFSIYTYNRNLGPLVAVADLSGRRALRSASTSRLVILPIKLSTVGSRAFPVAAAQVWNGLPEAVISS